MDVAYYPGCSLKASSNLYDIQSVRVFKELGINLVELEDWTCCGATSAGKTDPLLAIAMPARNLGIAESMGMDKMVIPCSACYSRTLVARVRLAEDHKLRDEINAELEKKVKAEIAVSSILELLTPLAENGALAGKAVKKLTGVKAACYYGCMLSRFPQDVPVPDDVENPQGMEKVLAAIGAKTVDWSFKTDCCGASAAVNDQDTALNLMARIMKDAVARGANCFVTTCPMCQMNMDAYQEMFCEKHGICERMPVYFITELVGWALGIEPVEMQVDRHFVESVTLLKESNPA